MKSTARILRFVLLVAFAAALACEKSEANTPTWTERIQPITNHLFAITYGNGTFVAAGASGKILISTNGSEWIEAGIGVTSQNIRAATFGENTFLLAGDSGLILTSLNGTDWTAQSSGITNQLNAVTFGNNTFVVVGHQVALRSSNLVTWSQSVLADTRISAVTFGRGLFVGATSGSAGGNGRLLTSVDGETWVQQFQQLLSFYSLAFGKDRFAAFGRSSYGVSDNGTNWVIRGQASTNYLFGMTHAHGIFVGVGGAFNGSSRAIAVSANGTNWTEVLTQTNKPSLRSVVYGNGSFVAVGDNGGIVQSGPVFCLEASNYSSEEGIRLTFHGEVGRAFRVQSTSDLETWIDFINFTNVTEKAEFVDASIHSFTNRFYRVVSP